MSSVAQPKAANGRRMLAPFVALVLASSALPFVLWPSLLMRAGNTQFLPHRFCYLDSPDLIWVNVVSDAVIGLAYIAISATLAHFVNRARGEIPFSWMFLAFGLFIVACGFTHVMEVVTVWRPYYWLSADVKIVTAVASVVTAFSLPVLVPRAMALVVAAREQEQQREQMEQRNQSSLRVEEMSAALAASLSMSIAFWERNLKTSELRWWGDVERVYGLPAEEVARMVTSRDFLRVVHPEDRARVEAEVLRASLDRHEFQSEFRVLAPGGQVRWIMGRGSTIYGRNSEPVRMVGVNMDVTARRLADEAMRRSEKLALTGRMAATIAHEINNPLSAVTNLNYLIAHDEEASGGVREMAELSMRELERIAHIVRTTLIFHSGSGARSNLELGELIDSAVALYSAQLTRRQIHFRCIYREPLQTIGVSTDLRQVFANLLHNAADALGPGGAISVRLRRQDSWARIDVTDCGQGIDPAHRDRLFEPFFTTKGERGTGLGLWVSTGIVQKHGGSLRVRSRFGGRIHGTRFTILLPLARESSSDSAAQVDRVAAPPREP